MNIMKNSKMNVAIIGAGINGLYIAQKLAKKGHKITVFEKNPEIGDKVCSGLFSSRILDFVPESKKLIEKKINYAILNFPRKKIKLSFSKQFLVMDHSELDKLAAKMAKKRGAGIFLNREISKIPFGFDRIIGSDGTNSFVRQKLKLKSPKIRLGIQGFIFQKTKENYVETWPTKSGFIWKIPRKNKIEYGIMEKPESAKIIFNNFLAKNNIKIENIGSKLIPQGLAMPSNSMITLCGDAAGLTKPWSGGGVIWGLKAADMLIETFPDFSAYKRRVLKFFLPKIIMGKMARNIGVFTGFYMPYLLPKNIKIESDYLL